MENLYLFPPLYVLYSNKLLCLLIPHKPCHPKISRTKLLDWLIPLLHLYTHKDKREMKRIEKMLKQQIANREENRNKQLIPKEKERPNWQN